MNIFRTVNVKLAINLVFVSLFCIGIGILASHRIAGPIDRMVKFVDSVTDGNYTKRLQLRQTDELNGLAEAVNKLVDKLEGEKKS